MIRGDSSQLQEYLTFPLEAVDFRKKMETGMELTVQELQFPANCASHLSSDPFCRRLRPLVRFFSGVAKSANVVAVKVLSDDGSGQNSDM